MDYSWLDRLPRIDKSNIAEPAKYWALYAKSFYEDFLGLINNPRRLRKATIRKLDQLQKPEERDALLFFFRIRRDELDGIPLWESLKTKYIKLLKESPDMIEADNLSFIRPGKTHLGLEEFQFPFGYYGGKMRVGKLRGIHPDIYNLYPDMQGFKGRMNMEYSGRVWIYDKIISFWDYPPTKEELLKVIKDIEDEFREKFRQPLYINPKDWYIEIIDKRLRRNTYGEGLLWKDWNDAENATLVKIDDYKGSGEWSEEKRTGPHIAVPRGDFGSKHPKYQGKQKEKRYMFAEGYVFESLEDFVLNENMGNLARFNLPRRIIQKIMNYGGWDKPGQGSEVNVIEVPNDPKKFSKVLNQQGFAAGIISVDGEPKYFFRRESERKFELFDLDSIRKYERDEYERKMERKREREERERKSQESQNENLNERRRGYYNYDPGLKGSYSGQGLAEFIQGLEGDVTVELIGYDKPGAELRKSRSEIRQKEIDPLDPEAGWGGASQSSEERYKKYATKKRLQIDKSVEDIKADVKEKILDNFDKVMDDIIDNLRRGYSWYGKPKELGEKLVQGVDLSKLEDLAAAYDAVEPGSGKGGKEAAKASRILKRQGYIR